MRRIVEGVWQLDHARGANAFLVDDGDGFTLVDPGMKGGVKRLREELAERTPIRRIVLTHYDIDHAGAAAVLQRILNVPVHIGSEDAPILRRTERPTTAIRRILTTVGRVEVPTDLRLIHGEDEVVAGIRTIASPGHTPGHRSFLAHGVLLVGDAATTKAGQGIVPFVKLLHTDVAEATRSEAVLREVPAVWAASGHGQLVRL